MQTREQANEADEIHTCDDCGAEVLNPDNSLCGVCNEAYEAMCEENGL